jgi:hypothetical protein
MSQQPSEAGGVMVDAGGRPIVDDATGWPQIVENQPEVVPDPEEEPEPAPQEGWE